jgi:FKBP-type peptidyl-prolyl cis-trans isomerase FklB
MRVLALGLSLTLASTLAAPAALAQDAKPAEAAPAPVPGALKDAKAQASYAIGLSVAKGLKHDMVEVDPTAMALGLQDGMSGAKPQLTEDQMRAAVAQVQADVKARRQEKAARAAATNKSEGEAFLKANHDKPGVITQPSGLQYQVLTAGTGPKPAADDSVICNYRGALLDGTEFDSSYQRGAPDTLPVSGVIKGWTEALQLMPVGSKWRIYVPANLAYGEKGAGEDIGPNAVLVFDIELLSIQSKG